MAVVTVDYTGMQGHVYTLLLEGRHYYVGWSSAIEHRIAQHFSGTGSKWTTRHPPVQVLTCVAGGTKLEDVVTISLMCRHGWQRVRGGRCARAAAVSSRTFGDSDPALQDGMVQFELERR